MRKIIAIGLLMLVALFTSPIQKQHIQKTQTNYFKIHIKVNTPEISISQNKKKQHHNNNASLNNINSFYENPKFDLIQNLTNTNKKHITSRHKKGKIAYIQKTTTP
ncbi:hypothetical protein LNP27_13920 [Flavobacterium galactosidilyticum]|uniref:hypothetical protein n=1 Tax=Flavobacterium galactosidilyticum TaxID=2893886 RepID=UPI001E63D2B9|nr:hypothetical protein [Flavobacterium sp. F-340]UFH46207.1 hypothetical protein LNP27_13920 [Flavobacterium sp. F-340]